MKDNIDICTPAGYDETEDWGLFLFVSPGDDGRAFGQYHEVLAKHKLLLAAPAGTGNGVATRRRLDLTMRALQTMKDRYRFDRKRVIVGGYSGGGSIACIAAVQHPDCFRGVVSFAKPFLLRDTPAGGNKYWATDLPDWSAADFARLREHGLRWTFITGELDFNHQPILASGPGWEELGFPYRIFDVPGLEHPLALPEVLNPWFDKALCWIAGETVAGAEPRYEMYNIAMPGR